MVPLGSRLAHVDQSVKRQNTIAKELGGHVIRNEKASQEQSSDGHRQLVPSLPFGLLSKAFGQCIVPLVEVLVFVEVFFVIDRNHASYKE